ncbi:MAG: heavy metal transport/detoxification protein [Firmicutes bacterium HGW-Firmicutes-1]|jgi:copper ion binding protein|nr:MAG: heavy metal transport/detoxification protein [Firmicutes bacterium HGW-Firmicutes-1]
MKKQINIKGMSCTHCIKHVENALEQLEGVSNVSVDLENNSAIVELHNDIPDNQLEEAIEEAGYNAVSITNL